MEEARALKRQRTTTRQNPFFDQLNYDVRRIIYDHLTLPPFTGSKSCAGMYLSCRQFKHEMDQAASVQFRTHLLSHQRAIAKDSEGLVHVQIPKEVETQPIPTDTIMDISVTINAESHRVDLSRWVLQLRQMLLGLNIGRLHIHIIIPFGGYYIDLYQGYMAMTIHATELLRQLLGPYHDNTRFMRVRETMMTWKAAERATEKASQGTQPENEALILEGHKIELVRNNPSRSYSYWFRHEAIDCGAWIIITPNPHKAGGTMSSNKELDFLTSYRSVETSSLDSEFSKATIDFMTLEVGEGEKETPDDAAIELERFVDRFRANGMKKLGF